MTSRTRGVRALVGVALGAACLGAAPGIGAAQASRDRVDLYDAQGRRTGYAVVDRRTGRLDVYDAQSRRLGYGVRRRPGPGVDLYRSDGRRWLGAEPAPGPPRGRRD
jgi:hypothetical protein